MAEHHTGTDGGTDWRELIAVVLLAVTTILTAWSGFQASKWSGAMSISFSQASTARIQAARHEGVANRQMTIQVGLFTSWLQAAAGKDQRLMTFLSRRFPAPLDAAFAAWTATDPQTNPDAPSSPFVMPEYKLPDLDAAKASDHRADRKFALALAYNQRGDNYTLLAVAFASVLFFAAISARPKALGSRWALLGVGLVVFVFGVVLLASFPKLV